MADITARDMRTSAIRHDDFDRHAFEDSLSLFPKLRSLVNAAARTLPTARQLVEDIFYSLYKPAVRLEEPSELSPSATINRAILEQMRSTTQYDSVRSAGTVGDLFYSAVAATTIARGVLSAVDEATKKRLRELAQAEQAAIRLYQEAETYEEAAEAKPDRSKDFQEKAQEARQQAQVAEEKAEQSAEALEEQTEALEDATRQAARDACESAEEEVEQMEAAIKSYSNAYGDTGPGTGTAPLSLSLSEKIDLAKKVGETAILQQVAELAGRMTRIAMEVQKTKIKHPPTHLVGVETGDNLGKVLPSELAYMSTPQLEPVFYQRYADRQLMQRRMVGYQKQGRGPIICVIDSSGSMRMHLGDKATKEAWSKAVALALLAIARKQKRDFCILHFSDSYSYGRGTNERKAVKAFVFPKGEATSTDLIQTTEFFIGGGTEFQPWMDEAIHQVDDSRFSRADVVCISDGEVHISLEEEAQWNKRRKAKGMRCWSVRLNNGNEGEEALARISDGLVAIDDMTAENQALQMMFSIGE